MMLPERFVNSDAAVDEDEDDGVEEDSDEEELEDPPLLHAVSEKPTIATAAIAAKTFFMLPTSLSCRKQERRGPGFSPGRRRFPPASRKLYMNPLIFPFAFRIPVLKSSQKQRHVYEM